MKSLAKAALTEIHEASNQSWIRATAREALARLESVTSEVEAQAIGEEAASSIAQATNVRFVKGVARRYLTRVGALESTCPTAEHDQTMNRGRT